jgi:chaperonin GroEL (HSP60 family)
VELNALESNANAVMAVADTVRTTLGPKGLDKLLIDQAMNRHVSNDGVTILLSLRAIHPVARMIVEIAERQEQRVGDGTTTSVVMAAEMIKEGKRLIKELGVHPTKVVEGIENGVNYACQILEQESRKISINDVELEQIVKTSLSSKLDGDRLSRLALDAITKVGRSCLIRHATDDNNNNGSSSGKKEYDFNKGIVVIRKTNVDDRIVDGIVLERKRIDPSMPAQINNPKIMITKIDLKPVKESWLKENSRYEEILTMEKDRASKSKEIVERILATGANTILIASPEVDELIENLLAIKNVFATRISTDEIERLIRYTGAKLVRSIEDLNQPNILGAADTLYEDEEKGIIFIEKKHDHNVVTIVVSGATKETSLERWRAALDGINAAEASLNHGVVAGGGAAELHIVERVKDTKMKGLEQVGIEVVTTALESIMRQILTNAGFNGLEKVMEAKASPSGFGIDINTGKVADMWKMGVIDPLLVKTMALRSAGEIAKSVLRIDRNLAAEDLSQQALSESKR